MRAYVVCVLNIGLLNFPSDKTYQKEKCNSPRFKCAKYRTTTFSLLIRPCFLAVYTTIAFKSYMPPTFSLRMFLVSCLKSLPYFLIFGAWVVIEGGGGGGGGGGV